MLICYDATLSCPPKTSAYPSHILLSLNPDYSLARWHLLFLGVSHQTHHTAGCLPVLTGDVSTFHRSTDKPHEHFRYTHYTLTPQSPGFYMANTRVMRSQAQTYDKTPTRSSVSLYPDSGDQCRFLGA